MDRHGHRDLSGDLGPDRDARGRNAGLPSGTPAGINRALHQPRELGHCLGAGSSSSLKASSDRTPTRRCSKRARPSADGTPGSVVRSSSGSPRTTCTHTSTRQRSSRSPSCKAGMSGNSRSGKYCRGNWWHGRVEPGAAGARLAIRRASGAGVRHLHVARSRATRDVTVTPPRCVPDTRCPTDWCGREIRSSPSGAALPFRDARPAGASRHD